MNAIDVSQNKIKFWSEDPNILFQKEYLFEFFPTENMVYEQKLNAITRVVIILTLVAFFYSSNIRILVVGVITLFSIYLLYFYRNNEKEKQQQKNPEKQMSENFENRALEVLKRENKSLPANIFDAPSSNNPLSNVLVTDYETTADKKPAPPAYNTNVNDDILKQAKQLVQDLNPDQPDISNKLFKDLGDEFVFEQSMRPFYSTANTRVENDQTAFAEFCFGSMVSCKEGNLFACARNLDRYQN